MSESMNGLAKRLTEDGYAALFGNSADQALIESIKGEPNVSRKLQDIINDRSISWQARFLASEFLFRYVDMIAHQSCDRESLEESYLQALRHNYTGNGVDWAFEDGPNDIGVLGRMVISWGEDHVETLRSALDDDSHVGMSFFWRIPPHFNPPYRVKDFAALIVARTHGLEIDLAGSPADRDRAIAQLEQTMK